MKYIRGKYIGNIYTLDDEKGHWITIKGTHVFIREGESTESAMKRQLSGYSKKKALEKAKERGKTPLPLTKAQKKAKKQKEKEEVKKKSTPKKEPKKPESKPKPKAKPKTKPKTSKKQEPKKKTITKTSKPKEKEKKSEVMNALLKMITNYLKSGSKDVSGLARAIIKVRESKELDKEEKKKLIKQLRAKQKEKKAWDKPKEKEALYDVENKFKRKDMIEKNKLIEFFIKNPYPSDDTLHKFAESKGEDPDDVEQEIYSIISTFFSGGRAKEKNISLKDIDQSELKMGIKIEMEHLDTKSPYAKILATRIAVDHLAEISNYYSELIKMEKKLKKKDFMGEESKKERFCKTCNKKTQHENIGELNDPIFRCEVCWDTYDFTKDYPVQEHTRGGKPVKAHTRGEGKKKEIKDELESVKKELKKAEDRITGRSGTSPEYKSALRKFVQLPYKISSLERKLKELDKPPEPEPEPKPEPESVYDEIKRRNKESTRIAREEGKGIFFDMEWKNKSHNELTFDDKMAKLHNLLFEIEWLLGENREELYDKITNLAQGKVDKDTMKVTMAKLPIEDVQPFAKLMSVVSGRISDVIKDKLWNKGLESEKKEDFTYDFISSIEFNNITQDFNNLNEDFSILHGPITRSGPFEYEKNGVKVTYYKDWDNIKEVFKKTDYIPLKASNDPGSHHAKILGYATNFKPNNKTEQMFADVVLLNDIEEITDLLNPEKGYAVSIGFKDNIKDSIQYIEYIDHLAMSLSNADKDRCSTMNGLSCNIKKKELNN